MSYIGQPLNEFTGEATAAIAVNRFVINATTATETSNLVTAAAGATVPLAGITTKVYPSAINSDYNTDAAAGDLVKLATAGRVYLEVNANSSNISNNSPLTATTAGVGVLAEADGDWIGAIALEDSSTDGDKILVQIVTPSRISIPA